MKYAPPDNAKCDGADCSAVAPWDMAAIVLNDNWFCSPGCAREYVEASDSMDDKVVLHDPQFRVTEESVNLERQVDGQGDAVAAIEEIAETYPGAFRVDAARRVNIKISQETKDGLDTVKKDAETWDECLQRLVQLERATRF